MVSFVSDYIAGAHPDVLRRLTETNLEPVPGYGEDRFCESAKQKIRDCIGMPDADVFFLVGGTQTNAVVISTMLADYEGVLAAKTGHVSVHEAGAIEYTGHEVLELPQEDGKLSAEQVARCLDAWSADENRDHMVMPGMVYISQPTEYGTLYTLHELKEISSVCRKNKILLYMDGARLAYALACPENDVTLKDIASLCDVFYIGGTKCGTLFGEAVVIPKHDLIPHLFTIIKQHGALLAKGRIAGIQFDTLFTDGLYEEIGKTAIEAADRIRAALAEKGYQTAFHSPTNQIFVVLDQDRYEALTANVELAFWEHTDDGRTIMRFATSWATTQEDVDKLIECL